MRTRKHTKLLREGDYMVEVDVELRDDEQDQPGWGPYLSRDDALKLDDVRRALRAGNLAEAGKHGRLYRIMPVSAA
jgi:hypothetical protein